MVGQGLFMAVNAAGFREVGELMALVMFQSNKLQTAYRKQG